ncbi:DUF1836 domain-containing protein [Latilactobacillus graminis]|uniref:DUF1836 domain-containing protein n=2 Tax=Latilactobacillus graminis TaxID=60519 RepID=A0AA89I055_9LACO|nr:DUF1836 domain-containing protein [Latilactobacillus graminis]KRM21939.1 hypothetical protein FC90_GL001091 [Latilactobacillus graminis DSM 20719]
MQSREFEEWLAEFQQLRLPLWSEFPDLELYMDQVISEINQWLNPLLDVKITKTMINSYVKMAIIERPDKKRYRRDHLAELIVVSIMKLVFPLEVIKQGISQALANEVASRAYDQFVALFNTEIANINAQLTVNEFNLKEEPLHIVQKVAVKSVIYKLIGTKLVTLEDSDSI